MGKSRVWKRAMKKMWEERRTMKRLKENSISAHSRTTKASKLLDEDLAIIRHTIEKQEPKQTPCLDPMIIKTLPSEALVQLIAERQGELKQLKIELLTRIV